MVLRRRFPEANTSGQAPQLPEQGLVRCNRRFGGPQVGESYINPRTLLLRFTNQTRVEEL